MTGIFFRVKRGENFLNIEIENLTTDEREMILSDKEPSFLVGAINRLCDVIWARRWNDPG